MYSSKPWFYGLRVCVFVHVSHPRLLTGRVSFGIAENEPDIFAELNGRLVLSLC